MPHYYAIDARSCLSKNYDSNWSTATNYQVYPHENYQPRTRVPRARSGSISVSSFNSFPTSPVNRLAQSLGPERVKQATTSAWSRHTTPVMSTRRGDYFFASSLDPLYEAKSNRRSVWQRFTENLDRCVFRVVGKFYK